MGRKALSPYSFAFILSQALWIPAGVGPASAQVYPSDCGLFSPLINPCVPHDVPAGPGASVAVLAAFAWQEFIALNWVALDPATETDPVTHNPGARGRPDTSVDFVSIQPDSQGNFPLVVWQTYRHKNELFPADGNTDSTFESTMPTYKYAAPVPTAGSLVPPVAGQSPSFNLFNNLDETSEIGLCLMYAHASPPTQPQTGIRVAYEAKVNRAEFDYVNQTNLTNPSNNYNALVTARTNTQNKLPTDGGTCSDDPTIVSLPCGDNNVQGDQGEGAIEIKAAWRQLTPTEAGSGKFFTQRVIYYTGPQGNQTYNNAVWGLVALHIIHKTVSFPAFVFASWEQVDNYNDTAVPPNNPNSENLAFLNTGTGLPNIPVTRAHAIHSDVVAANTAFHTAFTADPKNSNTVWQYYELIGVQAAPVNGPPPNTASQNDLSYYYLANIMVETNQTLQNFFGAAPNGVVVPFQNVYLNGARFQMGGCQGCHGTQGQSLGGDMSALISGGPKFTRIAESLDASAATAVRTYQQRSQDMQLRQCTHKWGRWGKDKMCHRDDDCDGDRHHHYRHDDDDDHNAPHRRW